MDKVTLGRSMHSIYRPLLFTLVINVMGFLFSASHLDVINVSLLFILLGLQYWLLGKSFRLSRDWYHVLSFTTITVACFVLSPLYSSLLCLPLLCLYPCWMWIIRKRIKGERSRSTKEIYLVLVALLQILAFVTLFRFVFHFLQGHPSTVFQFYTVILHISFLVLLFILLSKLHHISTRSLSNSSTKSMEISMSEDPYWMDKVAIFEQKILNTELYLYSGINMDIVVQETGIDAHHLTQIFKNYYHKNFYQLLGEKRIKYAQKLMRQHDNYTIESISDRCGFNSKTTFYKYFKKFTGYSPAEYLKQQSNS